MTSVFRRLVTPKPPYNFDFSVKNPAHYPTPTVSWVPGKPWFTLRWKGEAFGVRLANRGSVSKPRVEVTVYSQQKLEEDRGAELLKELGYRFELFEDYREFYKMARKNKLLSRCVRRLRGMRGFCVEGLYEYLMIAILLQNATVRRTEAMSKALLEKYGSLVNFGHRLYCFWTPKRVIEAGEAGLRALKVGYRSKSVIRASIDLGHLDEMEMRNMDDEHLRKTLLGIYGVGPASVDYIMSDVFHRTTALNTLPTWETKIYSRILFNKPWVNPKRILAEFKHKYDPWRGLAAHYLFMDIAWRHKEKSIQWFSNLMPY